MRNHKKIMIPIQRNKNPVKIVNVSNRRCLIYRRKWPERIVELKQLILIAQIMSSQ